MEWINFKAAIKEWLLHMNQDGKLKIVKQMIFGWKHLQSIQHMIYLPKQVFCDFSIKESLSIAVTCGCHHHRWAPYLDQDTTISQLDGHITHVYIADLNCIQDRDLHNFGMWTKPHPNTTNLID